MAETRKYPTKSNLHCLLLFNFPSLSHRQIAFLGVKESFRAQDKVSSHEKLAFRSGVRFLFLFVLIDAILLKLDLQFGQSSKSKVVCLTKMHHISKNWRHIIVCDTNGTIRQGVDHLTT